MSAQDGAGAVALRYDRFEDRLVLSFAGANAPQRFWITRRQGAGLIKSMNPAARKAALQAPLPRGKGPAAAGLRIDAAAPVLAEIVLRRTADTVRVGFRCDGAELASLQLTSAEFTRLQSLLCRMMEAAQWSLVADSPRESSGSAARTTVGRRLH